VEAIAQQVTERVVDLLVSALDVNELAARIDLNALLDRVDINRILKQVDLNALLDQVDVNAVLAQVDLKPLLDRIDVNDLVSQVDMDALVERTDLGAVIARSSGGMGRPRSNDATWPSAWTPASVRLAPVTGTRPPSPRRPRASSSTPCTVRAPLACACHPWKSVPS